MLQRDLNSAYSQISTLQEQLMSFQEVKNQNQINEETILKLNQEIEDVNKVNQNLENLNKILESERDSNNNYKELYNALLIEHEKLVTPKFNKNRNQAINC